MLPNCTIAVEDAVRVEIVPAQGNTGFPVSVSRDVIYNSAPVKHVGKMRNTIGTVPTMIWRRESLMIPHNTDVGQSGPPINMATFGTESPSFPRTSRIAFINEELMPTNCLTLT
mmetsp:Transcript_28587/g.68831  ORF Transcript_28587/g.68831 Transcript_28587/m.68831 type:complete len:114 (+) Transcript_28587:486-827(+)